MTQLYIGTKFDGHDSAIFMVCPARNGLWGLATERLTRRKHDSMFPIAALERLVAYSGVRPKSVERVFFANSFSSDRDTVYPAGQYEFDLAERQARGLSESPTPGGPPETLHECMTRHLARIFPGAVVQVHHHDHEYCHALSSCFVSPFDTALLVTMDGVGDRGVFSRAYALAGGELRPIGLSRSDERIYDLAEGPTGFSKACSIGGVYSFVTHALGFVVNCDEGKVEALAALGRCVPRIYGRLMAAVSLDREAHAITMDPEAVRQALSDPLIRQATGLAEKADIAATVQRFLEDVVVAYVDHLVAVTGMADLCLSGGVFANVILNMKIAERIPGRLFITPAVGDDGSAQGAAMAELLREGHSHADLGWLRDLRMPYFGTSYSRGEVLAALTAMQGDVRFDDREHDWPEEIAARIHSGQVGAVFQGRMEWGPRALGNRSILVDPTNPNAREIVNNRIKRRPSYQPVCPAMLLEEMDRLFEHAYANPHMTCAFRMRPQFQPRLPGAVHVDGTARVQFIAPSDNPALLRVLTRLKALSGFGVVLNTSFNMHGRTIVETPADALRDFLDMDLDFLAIEGYLVTRSS